MLSLNKNTLICSALTLISLCCSTAAVAYDNEKKATFDADVSGAELIKLNLSAGDVAVSGTTGNRLTAEVTLSCNKKNTNACHKLPKDLAWTTTTGSTTTLGLNPSSITNYDDATVHIKIGVPNDKKLEVSLSAGELRLEGTSACLSANVNAGEINIKLKENQLASAELNAKVGDTKLVTAKGETIEGERSLLVGARLDWKGTGACHAKASVLAGEVQLVLN